MPPIAFIRTKIIATLGPASAPVLKEMIDAGVDVFRINMAHGEHDWHAKIIQEVRVLSKAANKAIAILADLQGPRFRVGEIPGGPMLLKPKANVTITGPSIKPKLGQIPVSYPRFVHDVKIGEVILLDDGHMELRVNKKHGDTLEATVRVGGLLRPFKGINLPGSAVSAPALTQKDLADLDFALKQGVDYVGLSFTRKAEDVRKLKKRIANARSKTQVVAKIERPEAIEDLQNILEESHAVMVARGDLGVEMGAEEVPILQKHIIHEAIEHERPVITATQMLDSMNENPRPTRAEASDVANAIFDGTDAIMLASETARGKYPVKTVATARRIAARTEQALIKQGIMPQAHMHTLHGQATVDEGAVFAATSAAMAVGAKLIVPFTETGRTARLVASVRSPVPIVSFTFHQATFQQLALYWGTRPAVIPKAKSLEEMYRMADEYLLKNKLVQRGDTIILVSGTGLVAGATNTMRVHMIS